MGMEPVPRNTGTVMRHLDVLHTDAGAGHHIHVYNRNMDPGRGHRRRGGELHDDQVQSLVGGMDDRDAVLYHRFLDDIPGKSRREPLHRMGMAGHLAADLRHIPYLLLVRHETLRQILWRNPLRSLISAKIV